MSRTREETKKKEKENIFKRERERVNEDEQA
jgi:hypothetical protein